MVKWGKKTCMNMHEMQVFGIEMNTCRCVDAYVCVHIFIHRPVIRLLAGPQTVSEK